MKISSGSLPFKSQQYTCQSVWNYPDDIWVATKPRRALLKPIIYPTVLMLACRLLLQILQHRAVPSTDKCASQHWAIHWAIGWGHRMPVMRHVPQGVNNLVSICRWYCVLANKKGCQGSLVNVRSVKFCETKSNRSYRQNQTSYTKRILTSPAAPCEAHNLNRTPHPGYPGWSLGWPSGQPTIAL